MATVATPPCREGRPLADAFARHHPALEVRTLDGDPRGGPTEPLGIGWDRLAVALDGPRWALARGLAEARVHLLEGRAVLVLVAGTVAVLGPLDPLLDAEGALVVAARPIDEVQADGLDPQLADLLSEGAVSPWAVLARPDGLSLVERALRLLVTDVALSPGQILDHLSRAGTTVTDHPSLAVGRWRTPVGEVALLDVEGLDPAEPWVLSPSDLPPRVRPSEHPALAAALDEAARTGQMAPSCPPLVLPAAVEVDPVMRVLVARSVEDHLAEGAPLCPAPFTDTAGFVRWLADGDGSNGPGRYWQAIYDSRGDLQAEFPEVAVRRYRRFNRWAADRWRTEGTSVLLQPGDDDGYEIADVGRSSAGVNVLGVLDRANGLGEAGRQLADALEAAGLSVARVALGRSHSPLLAPDERPNLDQELRFDTSIVVGTAEEVPFLAEQLPNDALTDRRTIGYWFWELPEPSPLALTTTGTIDEVWTATRFVHEAFASRLPQPVRVARLPRPEPQPSARTRAELGLPPDRFVVLCTFSLLSVAERKNPLGTIEAFCRAFEPGEGPLLVVKTMHGDSRWAELERIRLAVGDRADIRLWDETLRAGDNLALIREADCLLSLHRSEGLGLPLLEAMALGTPVVATAWSGPVDFLGTHNAELVPFELVPVSRGEGAYAHTQRWAEPDLDAAAAALRRLADDPDHRAALAERAAASIRRMPGRSDAGRALRSMLGR